MNKELFICARFQAKPDSLTELRNRLFEMVDLTLKEEGCLFYNLHIDSSDESVFTFLRVGKIKKRLSFMNQPLTFKPSSPMHHD
jgi:hypothetical protein